MSETDLVKACLDYLAYKRVLAFRNNTGAGFMQSGRFVRYGIKGAPDIIAIKHGIFYGLECKSKNGRQSADQKAFEQALTAAGGKYYIVYNVDDLDGIL